MVSYKGLNTITVFVKTEILFEIGKITKKKQSIFKLNMRGLRKFIAMIVRRFKMGFEFI